MKTKNILFFSLLTFIALTSCAPVYKCGEDKPTESIAGSNRLLAVVEERDELCEQVKVKEEENEYLIKRNQSLVFMNDSLINNKSELKKDYAELESKHEKLETKYKNLNNEFLEAQEKYAGMMTDNFQRGHLYDQRIKDKERRLEIKEKELMERQKRVEELEQLVAEKDAHTKRLKESIRNALLGFQSDELSVEIKNGKVYVSMSDKLMFKSGSTNVEDKGKEALKLLARVIRENEDFGILIEGHTDNVPIRTNKFSDNWDLSVARATSMVRILADEHSIDPERLTASGKGEFSPKASNDTAEGRAQNRRTEIILAPKLDELMEMLGE